jgi:hypothetical protein
VRGNRTAPPFLQEGQYIMSLAYSCSNFCYTVKNGKSAPDAVERFQDSVLHYTEDYPKETDWLCQLAKDYLTVYYNSGSAEEKDMALDALITSAENFRKYADGYHDWTRYRELAVDEEGKIVIRVNKKKEAARLIAELDHVYNRLKDFQKEIGLKLFGLADVEEGLCYLKGKKEE